MKPAAKEKYKLSLFIAGMTRLSVNALINIKNICKSNLEGRYELEVIDIYKRPDLARGQQIIAAPTLIKNWPLPLKKFIGDMSDTKCLLAGMDIRNDA